MNYLTVDLYNDFVCIADACPNTCCAGWKIYIDNETYKKMLEKEDKIGYLASEWIDKKDDKYIVKLEKDGRCHMLNESNL